MCVKERGRGREREVTCFEPGWSIEAALFRKSILQKQREREGEGGREGEKEGKIFELRTKLLLKYWCCEKKKIYTHSSLCVSSDS